MIFDLLAGIYLAVVLALFGYVVVYTAVKLIKNRQEGIAYIRGFKKGKCGMVFLPALLLYWLGLYYADARLLDTFFAATGKTVGLVAFGFDTACVGGLLENSWIYSLAVYLCFMLVMINAIVFALSLFIQEIWNWGQGIKLGLSRKGRLIVIGNNPENLALYHSDDARNKLLLEELSEKNRKSLAEEKDALYMDRVAVRFVYELEPAVQKWVNGQKKHKGGCDFIVNTQDEMKNISICKAIIDRVGALTAEQQLKIRVYVFGDPKYEALYISLVNKGCGVIYYVNKQQKIAMDFADQYPFARFLDETRIDYGTSLVKEKVSINALLIGFGKTNQQIFQTSVANDQFLTGTPAAPVPKPVHYHIFDKEKAENNKNLNHTYYRYQAECCDEKGNFALNRADYLQPPEPPARETYYHMDINDHGFYRQVKAVVTESPLDANFVIIAFGSDLENLDLAQKLLEKRREWGADDLVIFVKVRAWHKEQTILKNENCYFFGHQQDVVFNIHRITNDKIYNMFQQRHVLYAASAVRKEYAGLNEQQFREAIFRNWMLHFGYLDRETNIYCCLSLRSKLNLMGLDYCEKTADGTGMTQEAYWQHYAGDDLPRVTGYSNGRPEIDYPLEEKLSRRRTMSVQEHQRWNAFMLSRGFVPATRQQILEEKQGERNTNGKNYALRRHGNLTNYEGLVEFRKLVAARDNKPEAAADVIKYDYQILDDAHWLLSSQGYQIIPLTRPQ